MKIILFKNKKVSVPLFLFILQCCLSLMVLVRTPIKKIRAMLEHHDISTRRHGVQVAVAHNHPARTKLLKTAVFDYNPRVRGEAALALAKRIGIKATAEFILKRYPGSSLSRVPAEFFLDPQQVQKINSLRKRGNPTMAQEGKRGSTYVAGEFNGEPIRVKDLFIVSTHRGMQVRGRMDKGGENKDGHLMVGLKLPKKAQKVVAEHEYGENFCLPHYGLTSRHDVAVAMEAIWISKRHYTKKYLKQNPNHIPEFRELIEKYPGEFPELERALYTPPEKRDFIYAPKK